MSTGVPANLPGRHRSRGPQVGGVVVQSPDCAGSCSVECASISIELLHAAGVPSSCTTLNPGPLYCKIFIHHKGKVVVEHQSGLEVVSANCEYPTWSDNFDLTVPNGDHDLLTIQVWRHSQSANGYQDKPTSSSNRVTDDDEYIAYTTVLLGEISSMDDEVASKEPEWMLQRSDGTGAPAGLLLMTLKWSNIFAVGRTIDISSAHRKM